MAAKGLKNGKATQPDSVVREARKLNREGFTAERVANILDVKPSTVRDWCNGTFRRDAGGFEDKAVQ